jgi:RHS repeat-associated protein
MGIKKYDKLNRLSKVQYPNATEEFEYDMAGNRIKRAFNNITTSYDYDRRNRLTEKVEGGVQTSYRYDPQGNLIAEEGRHGITRYTYDCFNLTASIQSAMGGYVQNRYDPEELRYELWENGKLSRFIFSGREVDANYSLKAAIVRGHEILAQKDVRDNSYYYLNNAHGDVVGLVDAKGTVVNSYKYDAFGNIVEAKEQVHNRFKYAGEQYDQVTGQYYLRARFYNPVVGRFTQEDTYRGDGLNLYSYVQNNPVKYVDPSGYCGESKSNVYEKGYIPKPGERSMTREQWKEQHRLERLKNPERIERHIEGFRDGGSFLASKDAYERFMEDTESFPKIGYPDNSMYITRKDYMDKILKQSQGDMSKVEKSLGFDKGHFSKHGGAVRTVTFINDIF